MEFEIYADIFFILNFFMNFFVLWFSSIIQKGKKNILRIFFGSFIMTIMYMVMVFSDFFYRFYGVVSGQIILAVGILIVFKSNSLKDFFIHILRTDITSAFVFGFIYMVSRFINDHKYIFYNIYMGFSFKLMILSSIIIYIITIFLRKYILKTLNCEKFCDIEIYFNNKNICLTTLIDTGNELKDPLNGRSAVISQVEEVVKLFDDETALAILQNARAEPTVLISSIKNSEILKRIRLLPFKSIDNDKGLMVGFLSDKLKIILSDGRERIMENVTIGIYGGSLSKKGIYKAIIDYESCNF